MSHKKENEGLKIQLFWEQCRHRMYDILVPTTILKITTKE